MIIIETIYGTEKVMEHEFKIESELRSIKNIIEIVLGEDATEEEVKRRYAMYLLDLDNYDIIFGTNRLTGKYTLNLKVFTEVITIVKNIDFFLEDSTPIEYFKKTNIRYFSYPNIYAVKKTFSNIIKEFANEIFKIDIFNDQENDEECKCRFSFIVQEDLANPGYNTLSYMHRYHE